MTSTTRAPSRTHPKPLPGTGGRTAAIFLVPFLVLFALTMVAPIAYAIGMSLFAQKRSGLGFGGARTEFVGLGNYITVLSDDAFVNGFARLAAYCLLYVPALLLSALVLALLLDAAAARLRRMFQLFLFLPHAVPGVIAALIWAYLYTPGVSPIVNAFAANGISIDLLSVHLVLPSVVNVSVWEWTGYNVICLLYTSRCV